MLLSIGMLPVIFTIEDVTKKLDELKTNISPGPDNIHPRVLHELRYVIFTTLGNLSNDSMNAGIIPEDWKTSTVTVIHKKGKKK